MGSTGALMAIGIFIGFLGGVVVGIILIVSAAYRREDSRYSLDGEPPDSACRGTRLLTGAWVRGAGFRPASWTARDEWTARDDPNDRGGGPYSP